MSKIDTSQRCLPPRQAQSGPELIISKELFARIPYSVNHLRRLEARGEFPRRVRIGANRIAWLRDEVEQWLAARVESR